jgi:hypothetical protein
MSVVFIVSAGAVVSPPTCATVNHVSGSNFEIEPDANLLDGPGDCIDWLDGGAGSQFMASVQKKNDLATGSGDDSFGNGTAEDNPNPTIVDGSIPPNKSDLKAFGVNSETTTAGKFLQLFWSRVQNPSGTTNMDFELNAIQCDGTAAKCANNGTKTAVYVTPKRSVGDKLITYDLSKGGTVPTISIRSWSGTAWGAATTISGASSTAAFGSVNTSAIAADGTGGLGALDPYTFGEASISYAAIFAGSTQCGTFGSAYLKSRSSDSFTSEIKDFIAPEPVFISNCAGIVTTASGPVTIGQSLTDTATLSNVSANASGTITFKAYSDAACQTLVFTSAAVTVNGPNDYTSGPYTPTAVGTYYWIASYSGDPNNTGITGACGDAGESSVVNKAAPTLATTPSAGGTVGVTLNDSATLTNAVSPTGSIVFNLYPPTDTTCTGTAAFTQSVTLSGNTASTTGGFVTNAAGTWRWTASYAGDAKNESASSGCQAEQVTVTKATPSLGTTPSPSSGAFGATLNDSATLTNAYSPTGSIVFSLYDPDDATCAGTPAYTQTVALSGNTASTTPGFVSNKSGTWRWTASYAGDSNNESASSGCQAEQVTIAKAPSTIATTQRYYPNDSATLTGSNGNVTFELFGPYAAGDTINCAAAQLLFSQTVAQSAGSATTSNYPGVAGVTAAAVTASGTYAWRVTLAASAGNLGRVSTCGTERFVLTVTNDAGPGSTP